MNNLQDDVEDAVEQTVPILTRVIVWGIIVISACSAIGYALHTLYAVR